MGKTRQRAGSKTYWRKTVRHSPDLTRTTSWPLQRLTTSSLLHQLQCYCYQWYAYKAEWSSKLFFPSPKNKTRLLKEKDNEKSPAQQGSTLKRNKIIILTVSKAQGFFFYPKKKGTSYNLPKQTNKQTKQRTEDKGKHALTLNKNALTTLTHNSPHKLKM